MSSTAEGAPDTPRLHGGGQNSPASAAVRSTPAARPGAGRLAVRVARPPELSAAGRLTELAYRFDGHLDGDTGYADVLRDTRSRARRAELWVAVEEAGDRTGQDADGDGDGGQRTSVLGSVTYCPVGSPLRELAVRPDQAEFRMLAVDPTARGRGVGRALVEACIARARSDGARELVICSMPEMRSAHRLYGSLGFTRAAELDWWPVPSVLLIGFRLTLD